MQTSFGSTIIHGVSSAALRMKVRPADRLGGLWEVTARAHCPSASRSHRHPASDKSIHRTPILIPHLGKLCEMTNVRHLHICGNTHSIVLCMPTLPHVPPKNLTCSMYITRTLEVIQHHMCVRTAYRKCNWGGGGRSDTFRNAGEGQSCPICHKQMAS